MEKEGELYGDGNAYYTQYRMLDVRIGRWFSTDPVVQPWMSPYSAFDNNPIFLVDQEGDINIVYVYVSSTSKKRLQLTREMRREIRKQVNERFREKMHVKVRMEFIDYVPERALLDRSDALIFIGTKNEYESQVARMPTAYSSLPYDNMVEAARGTDDESAVELAANPRDFDGMHGFIDLDRLQSTANSLRTSTQFTLAFLINHASGHLEGTNHTDGVMMSGDDVYRLRANGKSLDYIDEPMKLDRKGNEYIGRKYRSSFSFSWINIKRSYLDLRNIVRKIGDIGRKRKDSNPRIDIGDLEYEIPKGSTDHSYRDDSYNNKQQE
jgi:RHS repeat-associated protein